MQDSRESPWKQTSLYLLTIAVLAICAFILQPFVSAIVGASVLAVIVQRPYRWLSARIGNRSLCAAVALVLILLVIVTPVYLLAQNLIGQAFDVITSLRSPETQEKITDYFSRHPTFAARINTVTDSLDLANMAKSVAAFLGSRFAGFIGRSFGAITQIVVMLFILFFLLRDRDLILSFVRSLLPMRDDESDLLTTRVGDAIYATALGRLAIAGIQGTLAGLGYWFLGVPNPLFWAILTGTLAMVPAFGAFLVWVPIALYLGFGGHWGKAAVLAAWGGGFVSTIDNFLYPLLIGPRLRQHTVAVLVSILGGITLFGIDGIVLGPVFFTLASTLLDIWKKRNAETAISSR
ncbi:MAG: AI-2E family transporter [Edaphobacter sp.]|uniref:AI-2E family transporter n=1 Tax=Edaphobacter sp. TaxID=1934404 RepID=UPI0023888247|nr:AI-2E family transporter [Edaphobacter sp.]MDE1177188.1 AI-2E family transporter [Edaphobacter sp.]